MRWTQRGRAVVILTAAALIGTMTAFAPQGDTGGSDGSGDLADVRVALVPCGAHSYFQPRKTAGEQAAEDFGLDEVLSNEIAEWGQVKQDDVISSLVANGYNAFGVFGVSPADINSTFRRLADAGIAVGSIASCPAGDENLAAFCFSTDTEEAAHQATVAAIDASAGEGAIVHLTGSNVDSNTKRRIVGVELVQHLSIFGYVAPTGTTENRVTEFVDHLHDHFADPCIVERARYVIPSQPGYSAEIPPESVSTYRYPDGAYWREEAS
jgi:ribose transport system substrate-binding protein